MVIIQLLGGQEQLFGHGPEQASNWRYSAPQSSATTRLSSLTCINTYVYLYSLVPQGLRNICSTVYRLLFSHFIRFHYKENYQEAVSKVTSLLGRQK